MSIFVRSALCALVLGCATSALAQTSAVQTIKVGDSVQGVLEKREVDDSSEWIVDKFDVQGTRGQRVTISLKSDSFDAMLDLDKGTEHLAQDDDGGDGLDSQLVFEFPDNGTFRINVTSSEHDETGAYTLTVARGGTPTSTAQTTTPRNARNAPDPQEIRYGQTIQSRITPLSPLHRDDTPYQPFTFRGKRGEAITIDMKSSDFDAYIVLQRPGANSDLETDDDSGGDTNAQLTFTLPSDGVYEIRANAVSDSATGAFSLTLHEPGTGRPAAVEAPARPAPVDRPPSRSTPISVGQTVRGALASGDLKDEKDDSYYDAYRLRGQARQQIVIQLRSDDFDAFLALLDANGKELTTNDDEDGTDSEITFTLPSNGDYYIKANSLTDGETGDYILGVSLR